jgi:hypothetical protein
MGRRITDLADPAFQAAFASIQRSWFRLETLQVYDAPSEREMLRAFLAGEPQPGTGERHDAWTTMIQRHIAAGRQLQRVHVIEEPLTPYIEFELTWGYAAGVAGGEDIRVIPVRRGQWPAGLPHEDFWTFDGAAVWRMDYDAGGQVLGAELSHDPADVARYLAWQDVALRLAIPLADYVTSARLRRVR